jgi:hypothetical protein
MEKEQADEFIAGVTGGPHYRNFAPFAHGRTVSMVNMRGKSSVRRGRR